MEKEKREVVVIGAGFSGLAASCCLAKQGYNVTVIEKHDQPGGRARVFEENGFRFDMGPSWYWMPDVFENFFAQFGKKVSDYYQLTRLDPAYRVFYPNEIIDIPDSVSDLTKLFESREKGAGQQLKSFLDQAEYKYRIGMSDFVYRPSLSIFEYLNPFDLPKLLYHTFNLQLFVNQRKHVSNYFKDPTLISLLEWPVLFLGGAPTSIPALYSLLNHSCIVQGTWYPEGGLHAPIQAMYELALELGVTFEFNKEIKSLNLTKSKKSNKKIVESLVTKNGDLIFSDIVIGSCDYHHLDREILAGTDCSNYSENYWDDRVMSPSSLLFYLGISKRLENLQHHNLFFDEDLDVHVNEIYNKKVWPTSPLFYVCATSMTDSSCAPEGCENLFILIPLAVGLQHEDTDEIREKYFRIVMDRLEKRTKQEICGNVVFKRSYCLKDFVEDYHSHKGNAYGLANTLFQTAFLKPKLKNDKIDNLYYTGQLTTPGPGVPPCLISGEVVSTLVQKEQTRTEKRLSVATIMFVLGCSLFVFLLVPYFHYFW